jgi:hypothetical protein
VLTSSLLGWPGRTAELQAILGLRSFTIVGTGRREPLSDALAGGPPCRMAASADGRSWATPQARPECTPEPDEEVLARIVGAADGQAIPPQALAGSANIVDLKRAGGRRHSAGPGGPPRAESERPPPLP